MPPPSIEELIEALRKEFPHLSESALKSLANQQYHSGISYEDLGPTTGEGAQAFGYFRPADQSITINTQGSDQIPTLLHEFTHAFDYGGDPIADITSEEAGNLPDFTRAFDIAASAFGADKSLMNVAGLPQIETPDYLKEKTFTIGDFSGNASMAAFAQALANEPGFGADEALANVMQFSGGDYSQMPPSILPFLAELGSPSYAPSTAQASAEQEYIRARTGESLAGKLKPATTVRPGNTAKDPLLPRSPRLPQFPKAPKRTKPPRSRSRGRGASFKRPRTRTRGMGGLSRF